jgi:hypothetical protein
MKHLLGEAGRSFLRALVGSLIILLPGVLAAPNLDKTYALGVAAFISLFTALIKTIQVFLPKTSFTTWLGEPLGPLVDSFTRVFLGTLIVLLPGLSNTPNLDTGKAFIVATLIGAVTAGVRAVQGLLTRGDKPVPDSGLKTPPAPSAPPPAA